MLLDVIRLSNQLTFTLSKSSYKGNKYLYKCQKSKKYAQLYKRRKASKIGNAILWRSARIKYFLSDI